MSSIDKEEEEFFKEDNKSGSPKLYIILGIICVLLSAVAILLVLNLKNAKPKVDEQNAISDKIEEYAGEENIKEPVNDIIDRNEEVATAEPIATVEPTPIEEDDVVIEPLDDKPIMETDVKDYSKVKYDIKRNLSEMEGYFNDNNLEALDDLAHLDRYIAMSYAYKGTTDFAYFGDVDSNGNPNGKGIAVYADNQYYCGEWKNGVRSGAGVWVHYHIHLKENLEDPVTFHEFIGHFENDLPNGDGQDHYEYDPVLMVKQEPYLTNIMCTYKNGLIDGEVYATSLNKNGDYTDYTGEAKDGKFIYISESRDSKKRGAVLTDTTNSDNYFWISEAANKNVGVTSYISENK